MTHEQEIMDRINNGVLQTHPFKITVNGEPKEWRNLHATFDEIVELAGMKGLPTITFYNGLEGSQGMLQPDQKVSVFHRMVFNCSHTNDA